MLSENGRVKNKKETSSKPKKTTTTKVCHNCAFREEDVVKVFGEVDKCIRCGSEEIGYVTR